MGQHVDDRNVPGTPSVYSYEEEVERWRGEYLGVKEFLRGMDPLKDLAGGAPKQAVPSGRERRAEPRYTFQDGAQIFAHMGPKAFQIINIAIGGVAFYSDVLFKPGTKLLMSALGMIALDVEVLSCDMEEVNSRLMEFRYRVRARFGPRVNGYQVYVLAREMYLQQTAGGEASLQAGTKPEPGA